MINYEAANSAFFEENKNYLESILKQLSSYKPVSIGYCNSFGFDVEIKFSKELKQYMLNLKKKQSTQNAVVIPVHAHNNSESKIMIDNFPSNEQVKILKSSIKRLLMKSKLKDLFPSPYFAELSDENLAEGLSQWRSTYDIEELELYNQKLKLKTFSNIENLDLIDELEKILKTN